RRLSPAGSAPPRVCPGVDAPASSLILDRTDNERCSFLNICTGRGTSPTCAVPNITGACSRSTIFFGTSRLARCVNSHINRPCAPDGRKSEMLGGINMLDRFIADHRDQIVTRCRAKVAVRSAPVPNQPDEDYGVPLFLD